MASGEMHVKATVILTVPAVIFAGLTTASPPAAVACGLGVLAGVLLSPDLDMNQKTRSEYIVSRYMGNVIGWFWYLFWLPYAKMIPHRNALSHWPLVGTLVRLLYILTLSSPLWCLASWLVSGQLAVLPLSRIAGIEGLTWVILGLMAADALHWLMDVLPFFRQRRRRTWLR